MIVLTPSMQSVVVLGATLVVIGETIAFLLSWAFCARCAPRWLRQVRGLALVWLAAIRIGNIELDLDLGWLWPISWMLVGLSCFAIGMFNLYVVSQRGGDRCR